MKYSYNEDSNKCWIETFFCTSSWCDADCDCGMTWEQAKEMMCDLMVECKKEIDRYFEFKVQQYEEIVNKSCIDTYPEELYVGISNPSLYFRFKGQQDWDVLLFNRKLMEYKAAYIFNGQEFFDKEHTLPVSKGWETYCNRNSGDHIPLSCFHAEKAKELKLNWKEYNEKYMAPKGWFK